jgi:putative ABC transport system substrate-binding protein
LVRLLAAQNPLPRRGRGWLTPPGVSHVRVPLSPLVAPSPRPSPPVGAREFFGAPRRRAILAGITAILAPRPLLAYGQPQGGVRRLGALMVDANGPLGQTRAAALLQGLGALNWHEDGNLRIDWRWAGGDPALFTRYAAELVALGPEILVAHGSPSVAALRRETSTIPIVFTGVADPVGQGFVNSLARPGGTITGFSAYDPPMAGKWLQMLTQITPPVARVAVLYNPATAPFAGPMLRAIEETAPSLTVAVRAVPVRDVAEIEAMMAGLAREERGGVLVLADSFAGAHRDAIIALAARYRLPAVYSYSYFAASGGLMSYGIEPNDLFRRAAVYVDRILKGAKPADLPVQNPTRFTLVINLKTAQALGVTIAPSLLAAADEVIE